MAIAGGVTKISGTPSSLDLAAVTFYTVVTVFCGWALWTAQPLREPKWHRIAWFALAILFAVMAGSRILGVEEMIRDTLRTAMREEGRYADRRQIQAVVVSTAILSIAAVAAFWAWRTGRHLRGRRNQTIIVAMAAGASLVVLMSLRIVSLHAIDRLLYGPIKLNWVADVGASLVVAIAAIVYVKRVRSLR